MTERRDIAPNERRDIAPQDRAWFDRTCQAVARSVCRGRPALFEDAEAEARLGAWDAYRKGCGPPSVAFAARAGASACLRAHVGHSTRTDPETGRRRDVYGHLLRLHDTDPLVLTGARDGSTYDHPGLPARAGVDADVLGRASFEWLVAQLPGREAEIVRRHVADGATFAEIAAERGMGTCRVYQLYRQAVGRLRRSPDVAALWG